MEHFLVDSVLTKIAIKDAITMAIAATQKANI